MSQLHEPDKNYLRIIGTHNSQSEVKSVHKCSDSINSWISQLRSKFGLFFFFCHFCVLYVLFGVVLLLFETILSEVDAQVFRFNKYLDQSIGLLINILIVLSSSVNSVFYVFCLV